MSFIQFQCYVCNQVLKVGADKAGKKARCVKCGTILTIPVASIVPAPKTPPPTPPPLPPPLPAGEGSQSGRTAPPPVPFGEPIPEQLPVAELEELPAAPARPKYADEEPRSDRRRRRDEENEDDYDDRPRKRRRDEEDDYDDRPRGRRRDEEDDRPRRRDDDYDDDWDYEGRGSRSRRARWAHVRLGVFLMFIGACVTAGDQLLYLVAEILQSIDLIRILTGSFSFGSGFFSAWSVLFKVAEPIALGATITAIVGYVFCLLGPNRNASMPLAIAVIAVSGVEVLMTLIFKLPGYFSNQFLSGDFGGWFLLVLIHLLHGAQFILAVLLVRAFAQDRGDRVISTACIGLVSVAGAYTGVGLITQICRYAGTNSRAMGWITLILGWLTLLAFILFIIWYTVVLWRAKGMLERR